ncbi:zf-HC2 domain-containing protein [Calidifontibacter sp. DB0510]|uniref:Zf-HC2 domain-containing protein n=1 Tax=Metallococcus carri TaxID=1656884 RepID=A0A967EHK6_9MICO|nr:zf-HC2 domain-containing protein [Metallococcus carri]NHN56508.1 zf-HC2 domain-containing protein [Metallococcus carri]NOP36132.1 zf-HC2 domain-containing protein [Calidifontibacter sp. DB2511S]
MNCPAGDLIADYVEGMLAPAQETALERHLVACHACRTQVSAERELLGRLRAMPAPGAGHQHLVAGLMSLAPSGPPPRPEPQRRVPLPKAVTGPIPVTLDSRAPAQYVSARRSVGLAAVAAVGCLAAVAAAHVPLQSTTPAPSTERRVVVNHQTQPPGPRMMSFTQVGPISAKNRP